MSLSPVERLFFLSKISGKSALFEWGAGWTTVAATRAGLEVTSVEPSDQWRGVVQKELTESELPIFNVQWICPEYGQLGACAWPENDYSRHLWPAYPQAWKYASANTDVVVIDGRFRVACALQVALSGFKGILLLHDCDRPHYTILFSLLHLETRVEQLAAFTIPADLDKAQLEGLLEKHLYDPN